MGDDMSESRLLDPRFRDPIARRQFLGLVGAGAMSLAGSRLLAQDQPTFRPAKPNIIVILADDLGYADLGCQGCRDVPTPHIDSIAQGGVRFTNGYVSAPLCSPTRAGLMTGRYQQRFGHEFNPGPARFVAENFGLPLSEVTMANMLKDAGYATGLVGKWHLGYTEAMHPMSRGFDEFFGFLGGAHSYVNPLLDQRNPILRGREPVDEKEYLTDAFAREAVAFIDRHCNEPFFLYLPLNAVHAPMEATQKYLDRFPNPGDRIRWKMAAMSSAMDDAVGAVLKKVAALGHRHDTLVFFFSDNGAPTPINASRNTPLRGQKAQVYEGGIRIPFLLQWPARLPAGVVYDEPIIQLDILPTALSAAGGALPRDRVNDGVDLLPYLTGEEDAVPHDTLLWRFGDQHAVRQGNWKLVRRPDIGEALYDLSNDMGESTDVAAEHQDVVEELTQSLSQWEAELKDPLWGGRGAAPALGQGAGGRRRRRVRGRF